MKTNIDELICDDCGDILQRQFNKDIDISTINIKECVYYYYIISKYQDGMFIGKNDYCTSCMKRHFDKLNDRIKEDSKFSFELEAVHKDIDNLKLLYKAKGLLSL